MWLKMSSAKWRPFCLGLNVLKGQITESSECLFVCGLLRPVAYMSPCGTPAKPVEVIVEPKGVPNG